MLIDSVELHKELNNIALVFPKHSECIKAIRKALNEIEDRTQQQKYRPTPCS